MAWVHLRLCLYCGHVGCCDSSPGRHATHHYEHVGHPVMASFEPGERWGWCYPDEVELPVPPSFSSSGVLALEQARPPAKTKSPTDAMLACTLIMISSIFCG